jgi:hypothetical protein
MYNKELKGITYKIRFYLSENVDHHNIISLVFYKWRAAPEPSASRVRLASLVVAPLLQKI